MAWIELHQSLPTHHRTMALMDALDLSVAVAVGHLTCLWLWALDNAPSGALPFSCKTIARAAHWSGDPEAFVAALSTAGFVEDGALHDWQDYAGRLIDRRRADAEKQRQWRLRHQGRTSQEVTHNGDVTVTSPARTGATVPNPTQPNLTSLSSESEGENAPTVPAAAKLEPSHPAVTIARAVLHFRPDARQQKRITEAVSEDAASLDLWQGCCAAWFDQGYKSKNIGGILDWYADGGPPPKYDHGRTNGSVTPRPPGRFTRSLDVFNELLPEENDHDRYHPSPQEHPRALQR